MFSGITEREIRCRNIDFSSRVQEKFFDIQLEVQRCSSLDQSLQKFFKGDALIGENRYKTENDGYQDADIYTSFVKLPPVLMMQLKRFVYTGFGSSKITDNFEFYPEITLKENGNDCVFALYAVLVHLGSTSGSGHYISHCRVSPTQWAEFNDQEVTEVPQKRAIDGNFGGTSCAYMLIYVKKNEVGKLFKDQDVAPELKKKFESGCNLL